MTSRLLSALYKHIAAQKVGHFHRKRRSDQITSKRKNLEIPGAATLELMDTGIYLFEIYNILLSTQINQNPTNIIHTYTTKEISKLKQRFKDKNSQSPGHIVEKLLRILKEERNDLNHEIWAVFILELLQLCKLIIQESLSPPTQ